jgi:ABC-type nitrate/sulfonate/bicarbonate transport system substrate-binding protein
MIFIKRKIKPSVVNLLLLTLMVSVLAGCSATSSDKTANTLKTVTENGKTYIEIRIPDNPTLSSTYTPYIADAKGFFEEVGIKPIFTGAIQPGQFVAAVVTGDNEVGYMHVNSTLAGIAAGAPITMVVADPITTAEYPHMEFIVLEDSPLQKPEDIVGKKIGVTSISGCGEYTPYALLEKYLGISDGHDQFEFALIPNRTEETALRSGEVDVVGFHGHPEAVFERGGVRKLFDDYDVWGTEGGACPWYFRNDVMAANPEAVRRFVAAIVKTNEYIDENPDEARALQAKRVDLPLQEVVTYYRVKDGIITEESIKIWADILAKYGELDKVGGSLKVTDYYTNEFNEYSPDYKFK